MRDAWWVRLAQWYARRRAAAADRRLTRLERELAAIQRVLGTSPGNTMTPGVGVYRPTTFETACAEFAASQGIGLFLSGDPVTASIVRPQREVVH